MHAHIHTHTQYTSKEAALATRHRLHGLKWPSTNPKLLAVDFLSLEQVQKISDGDLVVVEAPPEVEMEEEEKKEREGKEGVREGEGEKEGSGDGDGAGDIEEGVKVEEKVVEVEVKNEVVRKRRRESEADKGEKKDDEKKAAPKKGKRTIYMYVSSTPIYTVFFLVSEVSADSSKDKAEPGEPKSAPTAEQEKASQATKLLDDLFRKTKATPCIYWLPLSEAEVCGCVCVCVCVCVFGCVHPSVTSGATEAARTRGSRGGAGETEAGEAEGIRGGAEEREGEGGDGKERT